MNKDIPSGRPTGAEQRARRQQAENEQRLKQQANAYQADLQRAEIEQRRKQQAEAQQKAAAPPRHDFLRAEKTVPPRGAPARQSSPERSRPPQDNSRQGERQSDERPRIRSRWFTAMVMVASTLALCVFLSFFLVQSAFDLFGLNQPDQSIEVTIPQDARISDVVRILGREGVVNQPLTFRLYMNFRSVDGESLLPGDYVFNSRMSYDEIIRALMTGRTTREVVRLTFIEGWTLLQVAEFLEENRVVNAEVFIEYLNTTDFGFEFFNMIDPHPMRFHMLEGYLFPDTYDFYVGENVSSVARKFLRNFNDRVMTPQNLRRMEELGLTVDETLTLASIIQREAGPIDDMRLVSSVFHNRLNSPAFPRLQSDVTIMYVESDIRPRLAEVNQELFDAYNTYVIEGLPVGPVCNPGMDAIHAALFPESTNFFFFVTDVNGDFYYATTYERHLQNIALAEAAGGEIHGILTPRYQQ